MGRRITRPQPVANLVGRNIHQIRTRRALTMTDLETATKLCGYRVPRAAISEMEVGVNSLGSPRSVTVDELEVIARALRVSMAQLLAPPRCKRCWDVPLPEFTCERCGASGGSPSARGPQTTPKAAPQRP